MQVHTVLIHAEWFAVRLAPMAEELRSSLCSRVSDERRARIRRFMRQEDADRSLLAELLIQYGAKKLWGIRTDALQLAANKYGKPCLAAYPDIHFNVAHSGDWVMCAWDSAPIGVDVEQVREIDFDIADRFFSEPERALMRQLDGREKLKMFYKLWSLKESFVKQIGQGLSIPLDAFALTPLRSGEAALEVLNRTAIPVGPYYLRYYPLPGDGEYPDYYAAICASHDRLPDGPRVIEIGELAEG